MSNWPGYWRMFKQSPIEFALYEIEKKTVKGNISFPYIYGPSEDYLVSDLTSIAQERIDTIFDYFQKHPNLLGVFVVNSLYYMLAFNQKIEIHLDNEKLEAIAYQSDSVDAIPTNWIPVGFERTICPTLEALITPGRIYMSPDCTSLYYKGEVIPNIYDGVLEYKSADLYKDLLRHKNKNGILFSVISGHILLE